MYSWCVEFLKMDQPTIIGNFLSSFKWPRGKYVKVGIDQTHLSKSVNTISTQTSISTLAPSVSNQRNIFKKVPPKNFACMYCDRKYDNAKDLQIHKKSMHDKTKDLECNQCDFTTSYPNLLKRHVKIEHDKTKYPCTVHYGL